MTIYLSGELGARLPPLRLVSRITQEYAGACPFCGGDERRSDRFHVWLLPAGRERYWCRRCDRKGLAAELLRPSGARPAYRSPQQRTIRRDPPIPQPEHIPHYRALYAAVADWTAENLAQPWNPEPLQYLQRRGFARDAVCHARLGYAPRDPQLLASYLHQRAAQLLPYAEAAGVLTRDDAGTLIAHQNLCGRIVIPYLNSGEVWDLRTRRFPGAGYTSLAGGYHARGATVPLCWDAIGASEVVIVTEGELKALAATAAYRAQALPYPAIGQPGLSCFQAAWAPALSRRGVRVALLAYDARAERPRDDHRTERLSPEEYWAIRHGRLLEAAGLLTLVLSLPLATGAQKEDLDGFLLRYGAPALAHLIHTAPVPLGVFTARLPEPLLRAANLIGEKGDPHGSL